MIYQPVTSNHSTRHQSTGWAHTASTVLTFDDNLACRIADERNKWCKWRQDPLTGQRPEGMAPHSLTEWYKRPRHYLLQKGHGHICSFIYSSNCMQDNSKSCGQSWSIALGTWTNDLEYLPPIQVKRPWKEANFQLPWTLTPFVWHDNPSMSGGI